MESIIDTQSGPAQCAARDGGRECYLPEGHRFAHSDHERKPFGEGVNESPAYQAMEDMARLQQEFYRFMASRRDQAMRNALRDEDRIGRIAHEERAVHDELNYLMRHFNENVQFIEVIR